MYADERRRSSQQALPNESSQTHLSSQHATQNGAPSMTNGSAEDDQTYPESDPRELEEVPESLSPGGTFTVHAGTILFRQGEVATRLFWNQKGIVKHYQVQPDGAVVTTSLRSGRCLLGLLPGISSGRHHDAAVCISACDLRPVSTARLRCLLRQSPTVSAWLIDILLCELHVHNGLLTLRGVKDPAKRLGLLVSICPDLVLLRPESFGLRLTPRVPLYELAGLLDITPQHLSRLIGRWAAEGILRREGSHFVVKRDSDLHEHLTNGAARFAV